MSHSSTLTAAAWVLSLLAACPAADAQSPKDDAAGAALATRLKKAKYIEVPLELTKTGLLDVKIEVNGTPLLFVIDTGAEPFALDREAAKRLKLDVKENAAKAAAIGGEVSFGMAKIEKVSVGGITGLHGESSVIDLAAPNATRKKNGDPPMEGILGGFFLKYYSAVIDYKHQKLYLLDREHEATSLAKMLKKAGYVAVPLKANAMNELDVMAEADGTPLLLLLDTGFFNATMSLDRAFAQWAKMTVRGGKEKASQLGGDVTFANAPIGKMTVGGLAAPANAVVFDHSVNNKARKERGEPPMAGLLGAEFFKKYAAIIDYGGPALYLLEPPRK